jgi:hypothetical protein
MEAQDIARVSTGHRNIGKLDSCWHLHSARCAPKWDRLRFCWVGVNASLRSAAFLTSGQRRFRDRWQRGLLSGMLLDVNVKDRRLSRAAFSNCGRTESLRSLSSVGTSLGCVGRRRSKAGPTSQCRSLFPEILRTAALSEGPGLLFCDDMR